MPAALKRPVSLREMARRLGVDERAIRKAIKTGRLERSVGRDERGRPIIRDAVLARREWNANRDPSRDRRPAAPRGSRKSAGEGERIETIAEGRRRLVEAQAKREETENARRAGELLPRREVEMAWSKHVVEARTTLLGLPSRAKQTLPHLTPADLAELERLIREALEGLADGVAASDRRDA